MSGTAGANLYVWTDKDGVEHYSSTPPDDAPPKRPVKKYASLPASAPATPVVASPAGAPPGNAKPAKAAPTIVLYTTSWCPVCKKARAYLAARGLAYQDLDVEKNPQAAAQYRAYGGEGVPLAVINGTVLKGFADGFYDQALAR